MKKLIGWIVEKTKVGQAASAAQKVLDGKKQALASLAAAIPATVMILTKFAEQGVPYLLGIATTEEFLVASAGWIGLFNAFKGEKIRAENAEILETLKQGN